MTTPRITLNDGHTIPQLGFGVWQVPPPEAERVVAEALQVGYRHIDTAQMYQNESGVGRAVAASGLPRADVFITTKVNNNAHRPTDAAASIQRSLEELATDYIDLLLIHWPLPTQYDGDFVSTWEALVAARDAGQARSIGVSNFQPAHLEALHRTGVTPAVNQIEVHPRFSNNGPRAANAAQGTVTEVWSPLGQGSVLTDPVITAIAERLGRTSAQVIIRWHLQRGDVVFPKTVTRSRMVENADVLDFQLTPEDLQAIDGMNKGEEGRIGPNPDQFDWIP
ncbi:putative oxidoreductase [Nocardioides baekrokdamisoli]|uniref:Putative oxidoreductase n=1 Tax=Nocardioides baekrokdamisoli TaxID=1804624 RepID=A0A3G9J3U6_9ACTN|nr:aldo/keto reductase [Nocardioides baekrokdamisoli]BBH18308.1 putative oxidoreductase [Nocardioides baekrokdamisoli]